MCLIASLPQNTYELAKIAWESGADALKVHINIALHRASQNHFGSLYGHHSPASLVMRDDINNFFAFNSEYSFEEMRYIANSFVADMLELSVVAPANYGERLSLRDLAKYQYIASFSKTPTIVPTQKVILPSDVQALYKTGIKAVMVGAISMGKEPETISRTLKAFRNEIDKL